MRTSEVNIWPNAAVCGVSVPLRGVSVPLRGGVAATVVPGVDERPYSCKFLQASSHPCGPQAS